MTPPPIRRAIVIVLDSLGIGELPDAAAYGDQGSDTLGHIAACVPLAVPALRSLGLGRLSNLGPQARTPVPLAPQARTPVPLGAFGRMVESAPGKDSVTGHWELMGLVLDRPFPVFPHGFPADRLEEFERRIGRRTLGNTVASGTVIIEELGPEHLRTASPIVYTSADSVFQIAAHEDVIPIDELYRQCEIAYAMFVEGMGVGRVIARPFVGQPGSFRRTANRRDFAIRPSGPTVLDRLVAARRDVLAIGKIEDLFAGQGITRAVHTRSDEEAMDRVEEAVREGGGALVFANLVDFDAQYGHRNNVEGYAENLERFDARLGRLLPLLLPGDLLILTADHGNDPTTPSTDHSREYVPVLAVGDAVRPGTDLGTRATFADLGATVAEALGVEGTGHGTSFLRELVS
ncbi:MAG TPA: phosphopentomutase [Vicinamibacterales bacterium]|nr:phosphopentomutase [Vicinamibacterales bacterium]